MADRYLLESGSPDGYLLEDGSGVLLLDEIPVAVQTTQQQAQDGAGVLARKPRMSPGGPYAPAFRNVSDLYRRAAPRDFEAKRAAVEQQIVAPDEEKPRPKLKSESPLLMVAQFGKSPVAIGIHTPTINEAIDNKIRADDDDAIMAIILALQ